jgi:predicted MFS family arabinose efflux permease
MLDARHELSVAKTRAIQAVGGRARLQVIAILAAVLGVEMADQGTVSAVSDQLERVFHINNTDIGLLLAVVSFVGALATLPMGVLADRLRRRNILMVTIALWAVTMVLSGLASSFLFLLIARVALGAVTAAAWPCTASLTGDFFPANERASIYGMILSGELIGVGVGFFISGEVSNWLGWRSAFFAMAVPAALLVWVVWRFLPEPQRGGQSWLRVNDDDPAAASEPGHARESRGSNRHGASGGSTTIAKRMRRHHVQPRQELVLKRQGVQRSWWRVLVYLLRLPTYGLLIAASGLAYYFFAGVRTFAMLYFTQHYGLQRTTISALVFVMGLFALGGVLLGGRLSEYLLRRGQISARIVVPAVALFISIPFLGGGIWTRNAWLAVVLLAVGGGALAAALPPLDAARLDIVPAPMWGRGEAGRMTLRLILEGGAPLLFGAMSAWLGGGQTGLQWTFLIMLAPMIAAGALAVPARRTYPPDVATAAATADNLMQKGET